MVTMTWTRKNTTWEITMLESLSLWKQIFERQNLNHIENTLQRNN